MKYIHYWLGDSETEYNDVVAVDDDVDEDEITGFVTDFLNDWAMEHFNGDPDDEAAWEDYCCETWFDWEEVTESDAEFIIHTNRDALYSNVKFSD